MLYQDSFLDSFHHTSFQNNVDPMFVFSGNSFVDCNDAAVAKLGFISREQVIGLHPGDISPDTQIDGINSHSKAEHALAVCHKQGNHRFLWLLKDTFGTPIEVEVTLTKNVIKGIPYILCALRNDSKLALTDNQQTSQNYRLLSEHKRAIDASAIVSKTDPRGVITYVNDKFCQVSGYSSAELIGQTHQILKHEDMPSSLYKDIWSTLLSGNIWQGIIKNKKKCGQHYYVDSTICPIFDDAGITSEYIALRHDITSIYEKDEIINFQNTDQISQLANSTKLHSDITGRSPRYLAVMNIPELKDIENAYSTDVYQHSVRMIADRMTSLFPNEYQIYRCFDNNFAVVTFNEPDFSAFEQQVTIAQTNFEHGLITAGENEFSLSMFVGIANTTNAEVLHNNALLALALATERNVKIEVYSPDNKIQLQLLEGIEWTKKLKLAIKNDGIRAFGQQIVDADLQVYSTEVLMRYFDPDEGTYVSPALFLGYAEKAKLYDQLTVIMLHRSFDYFSSCRCRFSLNLTMRDIENEHTRQTLYQLIKQHNVGEYLTIELVESTNYETNPKFFNSFIAKIKFLGCLVAIDDFGSGYSNFEFLSKSSIDIVKIDGSLIRRISSNKRHLIIVENIVKFCHALDLKVVAEFVEDRAIFETLKGIGVDYFQGYYIDKPKLIDKQQCCIK